MGDPRYFGGSIPFLKIADVTRSDGTTVREAETKVTAEGALRSRFLRAGTLVVTNSATVCVPIFLGVDACIHDGFVAFENLPDFLDQKYFYFFFKFIRPYVLDEHKQGVTQVNLNTGIIGEMKVMLPPANEQRRIVAKIEELFSELDKGVESLTTAREQLKLYRQAVLKHAFEGKLTADWRTNNPDKLATRDTILDRIRAARLKRYAETVEERQQAVGQQSRADGKVQRLHEATSPEWPEVVTCSAQIDLPKGWCYVSFEVLANSIRNGISKKPNETGELKIFRISAVRPMAFDLNDFRLIDDNAENRAYMLRRGDLVFTRYNGSRGFVGVAALFKSDGEYVYPDKLIRCDVTSPVLDKGFLEKAVNCGESRAFIESRIRTTAGQAGISGGDLKAMPVAICALEEQVEINRILEVHLSQALQMEADLEAAFARARILRHAILQKAFSGQLVNQDHNDEPASSLLKSTSAEIKHEASGPLSDISSQRGQDSA